MEIKQGIPVSNGIAIGRAFVLDHEEYKVSKKILSPQPEVIALEKQRYLDAVQKASEEIQAIEKSTQGMRDICFIFMGHRFIIEDPEIQKEIIYEIEENHICAEFALIQVMQKHRQELESLNHADSSRQSKDLEDIEQRLLRHIIGRKRETLENFPEPIILVARDLTPSQTAILPKDKILGFITDIGGRTSHSAIVARTRGIPAVVGMRGASTLIKTGDFIIVDGRNGIVLIEPKEPVLEKYKEKQIEERKRWEHLRNFLTLPAETKDGYSITIRANIEDPEEVPTALDYGASGIGLYRTEFIYVTNENPEEKDHYEAYAQAIQCLQGKKMIIRTLDFGADKDFGHKELQGEKNPFLGCRSIRLCFEKVDFFKKQLRAILRASVLGDVSIMFPMISSLEELRRAKNILQETQNELKAERIPYNPNIEIGIMIEIPSAAIIADLLIQEVDFFSIGTNDLIQYTLAVDRINERVASFYKPAHPAVLRLIKRVLDIGKQYGKKVSMCGEMSSEFIYLLPLIGMGLAEISVSPSIIWEVKELIRSITMEDARQIAEQIMTYSTHEEIIEYLSKELKKFKLF